LLVLASIARHWGSWSLMSLLLRLTLLQAAVFTFLAFGIARGRDWARIAFATLAVLDLISIAMLQALTVASVTGALGTLLRIVAVFYLFLPASELVFRPPGRAERSWAFPLTLTAVLVAQLALMLSASYYVAKDAATGQWQSLLAIFHLLITLSIAIAFCFTRNTWRRVFAKVFVVLFAVFTPQLAQALLPISEPLVAYHLKRDRYRDFRSFMKAWKAENEYRARLRDWQDGRGPFPAKPEPVEPQTSDSPARKLRRTHTAELRALFRTEQRVLAAGERFLILENGHCVVIYGVSAAPRQTTAFKTFAEQNIVGATVDIRLPEHHENIYIPGQDGRMWSGLEFGAPRDRLGRLYGEVQGLVFFDGRLLNLDYCRPQSRDTFAEYQQAYERGEL
jgi:hypothetical protein